MTWASLPVLFRGDDQVSVEGSASAASGWLAQLEQALFEAGEELAQRTEELQAARQINRELISRLSREQR